MLQCRPLSSRGWQNHSGTVATSALPPNTKFGLFGARATTCSGAEGIRRQPATRLVVLSFALLTFAASTSCSAEHSASTAELWYAASAICGLSREQLRVSANVKPDTVVSSPRLSAISDVALDAEGNVWAVGSGSNEVYRFPVSAFRSVAPRRPASAEPDLVIQSPKLASPGNLTFDAEGGLWVANRPAMGDSPIDGSIVRFDVPHGFSGNQDLLPTVEISPSTPGDFFQIGNIAFDETGSLWLTSFVGVLRFDDPRSLEGSVVRAADAVIEKSGYTDNAYFYSVSFDPEGALWAASGDGLHHLTSVTKFGDPGSLTGRSSPAADAVIIGITDGLPAGGVAFDGARNLWLATGESIVMYSRSNALSGTVTAEPAITLELRGGAAPATNSHLLFFPRPPGSIIGGSPVGG